MTKHPETYRERVLRYRILRHDDLPEEHKAAYRARGIDPDTIWSLIWSFPTLEDAEAQLARENADKPSFYTFKIVDGGEETVIERPIW